MIERIVVPVIEFVNCPSLAVFVCVCGGGEDGTILSHCVCQFRCMPLSRPL